MSRFADLDIQQQRGDIQAERCWRVANGRNRVEYYLPDNDESLLAWFDARKRESAEKRRWRSFTLTMMNHGKAEPVSLVVEFPTNAPAITYTRDTAEQRIKE